jgi:hypothetical protein
LLAAAILLRLCADVKDSTIWSFAGYRYSFSSLCVDETGQFLPFKVDDHKTQMHRCAWSYLGKSVYKTHKKWPLPDFKMEMTWLKASCNLHPCGTTLS